MSKRPREGSDSELQDSRKRHKKHDRSRSRSRSRERGRRARSPSSDGSLSSSSSSSSVSRSPSSGSESDRRHRKHKRDKKHKKERSRHKRDKKERSRHKDDDHSRGSSKKKKKHDDHHDRHSSSSKDKKRKELLEKARQLLHEADAPPDKSAITPISQSADYYNRNTEFSLWLKHERHLYFADLSRDEAGLYFDEFAKLWNDGRLPGRYYRPELLTADDTTASRTGYKWGFAKKLDALEMGSLRDRIHRDTAAGGAAQADSQPSARPSSATTTAPTVLPPRPAMSVQDAQAAEEERRERERLYRQAERRKLARNQREDLEELAPKATGREALLEKKKLRAVERRERELSPEHDESSVMGAGDDFQSALRRQRERQERAQSKRIEAKSEALAHYQAKEDATMQMFRQMVANNGKISIAPRPPPPPSS